MSCNCQTTSPLSPDGQTLPTVSDDCAIAKPTSICKTCVADDEALKSDASDGTTLPSSWLDSVCADEGVVILGRVGNKLARCAGNGFIKLVNGSASVVENVPLSLTTLWHRWWKTSAAQPPILGEPFASTYDVVVDSDGNLHAQKGVADEDSTKIWTSATQDFSQMPLSEIPLPRKGVITAAPNLELVGYAPIVDGGDPETVRDMRVLNGAGIIYLEEQDTIDDSCDCATGSGTASVAKKLAPPVPDADEVYTLKFSTALGYHWVEDV